MKLVSVCGFVSRTVFSRRISSISFSLSYFLSDFVMSCHAVPGTRSRRYGCCGGADAAGRHHQQRHAAKDVPGDGEAAGKTVPLLTVLFLFFVVVIVGMPRLVSRLDNIRSIHVDGTVMTSLAMLKAATLSPLFEIDYSKSL